MKTREEILADIVMVIHEQLEIEAKDIKESDYLYEDLCLESLEMMELVAWIEAFYGIEIDTDDIDQMYDMTIEELISMVEKFLN